MGTKLREIVYDIGGGLKDDIPLKAVQIGETIRWLSGDGSIWEVSLGF